MGHPPLAMLMNSAAPAKAVQMEYHTSLTRGCRVDIHLKCLRAAANFDFPPLDLSEAEKISCIYISYPSSTRCPRRPIKALYKWKDVSRPCHGTVTWESSLSVARMEHPRPHGTHLASAKVQMTPFWTPRITPDFLNEFLKTSSHAKLYHYGVSGGTQAGVRLTSVSQVQHVLVL